MPKQNDLKSGARASQISYSCAKWSGHPSKVKQTGVLKLCHQFYTRILTKIVHRHGAEKKVRVIEIPQQQFLKQGDLGIPEPVMKEQRRSLQEKKCRRKKYLAEETEAAGYFTDSELNYTRRKSAADVCCRQESPSPVKAGKRSESCDRVSRKKDKPDFMNQETSLKENTSYENGRKVQKALVHTEDGARRKSAVDVCSRQESPSPVKAGKRSESCDRVSRKKDKPDFRNQEASLKESPSYDKGKKFQRALVHTEVGKRRKSAADVCSRQESPSPIKTGRSSKSCDRVSRKKEKPDFRNPEAYLKESPSCDKGKKVQKALVHNEDGERRKSAADVCCRQESPSPVKAEKRSKSCDRVSRKKDKPDFMNQETSWKENTSYEKGRKVQKALVHTEDGARGKSASNVCRMQESPSPAKAGKRSKSCDRVSRKKDKPNFKNQETSMKESPSYDNKGRKVKKRLEGEVDQNKALPAKEMLNCQLCGENFMSLPTLKKHVSGQHMSDENTPVNSEFEWRSYAEELGLLNKEIIFRCDDPNCGRTFLSSSGVSKHRRIYHLESAPYVCKLCGKRYFTSGFMNWHEIRVHGLAKKSLTTQILLNKSAVDTRKVSSVPKKKKVKFLIPSYHSRIKTVYIQNQNLRGILKLPRGMKSTSESAANKQSLHEEVAFASSVQQPRTSLVAVKEDIVVPGESDSSCDSSDVMSPFQALLSDKQPFLSSKLSSQKHSEFRKDKVFCCHSHKSGSKFPDVSTEKSNSWLEYHGSHAIQTMPGESRSLIPHIYVVPTFQSDQKFAPEEKCCTGNYQEDTNSKESADGSHDSVSGNNSEKDSSGTPDDSVSANYSKDECCGTTDYTSDHSIRDESLAGLQQELLSIRQFRSKKDNRIHSSKTSKSRTWNSTKSVTETVFKLSSKKSSHNLVTSETNSRVKSAKAKSESRTEDETKCMDIFSSSSHESSHNSSVVQNTTALEDQENNAVTSDNRSKSMKSKTGKKNNISDEMKSEASSKNKEDHNVSLASAADLKPSNSPMVHSIVDIKAGCVKIPGEYSQKLFPIVILNKLNLKNYDPSYILHIDDGNDAEYADILTHVDLQHVKRSLRSNGSALDQDKDRNSDDKIYRDSSDFDPAQSLESVASVPVIGGSEDDKIGKVCHTEISKDIQPYDESRNDCIVSTNTSFKKKRGRPPHRSVVLACGQETQHMVEPIENKKTDDRQNSKTRRGWKSSCGRIVSLEPEPEVKNRKDKDIDTNRKQNDARESEFLKKTSGEHNWRGQDMVTRIVSFDVGTAQLAKVESSGDVLGRNSQTSQSDSVLCDKMELDPVQGKEIDRSTSISDVNETPKTTYTKEMKKGSKIEVGKCDSRVGVRRKEKDEPAEKGKTVGKDSKTGTITNKSQNNLIKEKPVDENLIIEEKQKDTKLNEVSYKQTKNLKSVTGRRNHVKLHLSKITESDEKIKSGKRTCSRSSKRINCKFLTPEFIENDSSDGEVVLSVKKKMDSNNSAVSDSSVFALSCAQDKSQESEKILPTSLESSADSNNSVTFFEEKDCSKSSETLSSTVGQNHSGSKVSSDDKMKKKRTREVFNSLGNGTNLEVGNDTSSRGKKRKAKDTEDLQNNTWFLGTVQSDLESKGSCPAETPEFREEMDLSEMDLVECTSVDGHTIEPRQQQHPNNNKNEIDGVNEDRCKVKVNADKKSLKVTLKTYKKFSKNSLKSNRKSSKNGSRSGKKFFKDLMKTDKTENTKSAKQVKPKLRASLEISTSPNTPKKQRQKNNSNQSKRKKSLSKVLKSNKTVHRSQSLDSEVSAAEDSSSKTVGRNGKIKLDSMDKNQHSSKLKDQQNSFSGHLKKLYKLLDVHFISREEIDPNANAKSKSVECSRSESVENMEHTCFETQNVVEGPNTFGDAQTDKTDMLDENLKNQKEHQVTKLLTDGAQHEFGDVLCIENKVQNDETDGSSSSFKTNISVSHSRKTESRKVLSPVSKEEPVLDEAKENNSSVTFKGVLEKVQPFQAEGPISLVNVEDPTVLADNDSIQLSKSFEYEDEEDMETELDLTVLQQTTTNKQTALDGFTSNDLLELICISDYQLELMNQISLEAEQELREKDAEKGSGIASKEGVSSIDTDSNLKSSSKENTSSEEGGVSSPAGAVCENYIVKRQNNVTIKDSQKETPEKEQNTMKTSEKSVTVELLNRSNSEVLSNICQSSEADENIPTDLDASNSLQTDLVAVSLLEEDLQMQRSTLQTEDTAQPERGSVNTVTALIPREETAKKEEVTYTVVACLGRYSEVIAVAKDNDQRFRSTSSIKSDIDPEEDIKGKSQKRVLKKHKIHNVQHAREKTDKVREDSPKTTDIPKRSLISELLSSAPLIPSKPCTAQTSSPLIESRVIIKFCTNSSLSSLRTEHLLNSTCRNKVTTENGTVTEYAPSSGHLRTPFLEPQGLGNLSAGSMGTTVLTNAELVGTAVLTDGSSGHLNMLSSLSTPRIGSHDTVITGGIATDIEVEIVDPSSQHRCELCGNGYESVALLAKHIKIIHPEHKGRLSKVKNAKSFVCQFCRSEFTTERVMYTHQENFHSDKTWTRPRKKERRAQSRYLCKCGLEYQHKRLYKQHVLCCAVSSGGADIENPDQVTAKETREATRFLQSQAFFEGSMQQNFHEQASACTKKFSENETDYNSISDVICRQCGSKFLNLEMFLNHQPLCGQKDPSTVTAIFESPGKKTLKMSGKNYTGKIEVQAVTNTLPLTEVGISSIMVNDQENTEAMLREVDNMEQTDVIKPKDISTSIPDSVITENEKSEETCKEKETLMLDIWEPFVLLHKIPLSKMFYWKSYKFKRLGSNRIQCWKMYNRKVSSCSSVEPRVSQSGGRESKKTALTNSREEQVTDFELAISRPRDKVAKVKRVKKRDRQSSNDSVQSDPVVESKLHTIRVRSEESIPYDSSLKSKLASSILKKEEIKKKSMGNPLLQISSNVQNLPPLVPPTFKTDALSSFKFRSFKKTGAATPSNSSEDMYYRSPLDRTFGNSQEKTWSTSFGTPSLARPTDSRKDRLLKDLEDTGISLPFGQTTAKAYKQAHLGDLMKSPKESDTLRRTSFAGLLNCSMDSAFQSSSTSSSWDHLTPLKSSRMPLIDSFRSCRFRINSPSEADLLDVSSISKDSSLQDEKDTSLDSTIVSSPLAERGRCLSTSTVKDGLIFDGSKLTAKFSQTNMKYGSPTKPRPTGFSFGLVNHSSGEIATKRNVSFSVALDQERKSVKLASTNEANSGANRKRSWKKRPAFLVSGEENDKKRRRLTRYNMDEDSHDSMDICETTSLTSGSESSGRTQFSDEKPTEKISVGFHPAQQVCDELQVCSNTEIRDSLKSQALHSDEEEVEDLDIQSAECSQIDELNLDDSMISTIPFTAPLSHPASAVKKPPYQSAERKWNHTATNSPTFSSNIKVTVQDQLFNVIDAAESRKSNGLDDTEEFEPDYADDIEELPVRNDRLDCDDCRVSSCESESIINKEFGQEQKISMEQKASRIAGIKQDFAEALQGEIFQGKTQTDRSASPEVVVEMKFDLDSDAGELEMIQVEQEGGKTGMEAENVEKVDCEKSYAQEEVSVEKGRECDGEDEDALSIYASSEASFLDNSGEEEECAQLQSRTPSPVEEHSNSRTSHDPELGTKRVVEELVETTEMDIDDQSLGTSDFQVNVTLKNSSEERRPRFSTDLYPKGCCFQFLAHGRCQKPNCNFSHKQPSQEEMLQHCLKKISMLRQEGDVERLFTLYEDFRSKEIGRLPPPVLQSLYQEAVMRGMVYQSYSLLEDLIRQHYSYVTDRMCTDFIRLCGSNYLHFEMVWNILKTMMALQYLPEGDVLIMTLRGCVDSEDWDKLWELMLKCNDYNDFIVPVTFQAMALLAFVHQPKKFIEYAFQWLMKEPNSLDKLDKELLLKVADILDEHGHRPLAEKLRAATKRIGQQVKSRSISPIEEASLQETNQEIDNEIMKENQHKIQTCKLTSNWHYLGRIFVDVLTLDTLNNSVLLDNYTDALEQKTHRQSDPGCVGEAFKVFLATVLKEFQEEKSVNVFAQLDIQTLSWIGNNLLFVCFDNKLWESGYEVLSTLVKAKIPNLKYKRHEHRNIPFIAIFIYLENNDSKGAMGILDAVRWDKFENQRLGDWQLMVDVLIQLFHHVLEDRSHISARKVLVAILEQSKKATRFTIDINSHIHFQKYFNALLFCSLKAGDVDSAVETYKLHESSSQLEQMEPLLQRAIVIGLVRAQHMIEAKDFFEQCKAMHLYENQTIAKPRIIKLDVTYNPEEIYLSIHDYLCCLYNHCCDQVYEGKTLTQEDLTLEILIQGNVDQQLFSMPYLSGAPRSYHLAVKMVRRVLQLEFRPPLETNIITPDLIQITSNSLEKYLKEYDQKFDLQLQIGGVKFHLELITSVRKKDMKVIIAGRRQGLMFRNLLHKPQPLMPAPRVPRPGPRAFRGRRGVTRAGPRFRIGGRGHIKPM